MNKLFQVSLKVILKNDAGEVLALYVPETSQMAGYCDFPGGRIDENEVEDSLESIIDREIKEELGEIKYRLNKKPVAISRHYYIDKKENRVDLVWVFFEAKYLGGEIKISDEHLGMEFLDLNNIDLNKYFTRGSLEGVKNYLGRD